VLCNLSRGVPLVCGGGACETAGADRFQLSETWLVLGFFHPATLRDSEREREYLKSSAIIDHSLCHSQATKRKSFLGSPPPLQHRPQPSDERKEFLYSNNNRHYFEYAGTYSTTPVFGLRRVFLICRSCFLDIALSVDDSLLRLSVLADRWADLNSFSFRKRYDLWWILPLTF